MANLVSDGVMQKIVAPLPHDGVGFERWRREEVNGTADGKTYGSNEIWWQ